METQVPDTTRAPDDQTSSAGLPAAACQHCGEQLELGQEWCLECGSARRAARSRRGRDATRAATTIAAAVALLVGGAAAASYAALTDDPAAPVVASVAAPAAVTTAPPPATTTQPPATTTQAPAPTTAKLPPIAKTATLPPVPKSPTPTPTTKKKTTTDKTKTTTKDADSGPTVVALGAEAAAVYDPYTRASDQTDPADSYDDDAKTAFTISTAPGPATMGIGVDYNLGTARAVRQVEIKTTTPGFSVEVYGAEAGLPANILDPSWKHLADAAGVATKEADDGTVTIEFTPGRYRHILLWFTTPPSAGPAVALSEVRLLD